MDAVNEAKEKVKETAKELRSDGGGGSKSLARKVFVPLAASAASAAAAFAARKAPDFFRDKVLPKLKEAGGSGGAQKTLAKAKDAVGDTVSSVTDRLGAGDGQSGSTGGRGASRPMPSLSPQQREKERRERADRRRERQQALKR
jgi:hypothetical protein